MKVDELGPFELVLDVGGNVGDFALCANCTWPAAELHSFEPIPGAAYLNRKRSAGRWTVHELACSSSAGRATLRVCQNQHTASTMMQPGGLRRERFGIRDVFLPITVETVRLDELELDTRGRRTLLKVDVEGHELEVLHGAEAILRDVAVAIVECNQEADIFIGAPPPGVVDDELRRHGLFFVGVAGVQLDPQGEPVQFDGVWSR